MLKKKIVLTGSFGVGKTAIFNSLISQSFPHHYIPSLGIYVEKIPLPSIENKSLYIWDLPGEVSQEKVPKNYFFGTDLILFIIDLTRPSTYLTIENNLAYFRTNLPTIPVKIIGNKMDLVSTLELKAIQQHIVHPFDLITSAKTRNNILPLCTNFLYRTAEESVSMR